MHAYVYTYVHLHMYTQHVYATLFRLAACLFDRLAARLTDLNRFGGLRSCARHGGRHRESRTGGHISEPPKRVVSGWVVSWDPSFALHIQQHVLTVACQHCHSACEGEKSDIH